MLNLPEGWADAALGEIALINMGQSPEGSATNDQKIGLPLLGGASDLGEFTPKPTRFTSAPTKICEIGDLIYCIRATIGKLNVADQEYCLGRGVAGFRSRGIDPGFLRWLLIGKKTSIAALGTGTTFLQVSKDDLTSFPVTVPPINEQRRIVAKLDALFEKSRSIREKLDFLPRLLANLQKSILNSAFRGDLTKEWRANNPNVEPTSELLKRIRAERRAKWEADLIAKGKDPKKAKYIEPEPVDAEGLPELPDGWCWATVADLLVGETQNGLYLPSTAYAPGVPMLRITDYQVEYSLDATCFKQVLTTQDHIQSWMLEVGNVLVNRVNSPSHLGKALVVEARHVPALFESNMMRLRPPSVEIGNWIASWINSPVGKAYLMASAKWAVNQASVNQRDVLGLPIPLAPTQEIRLVQERLKDAMAITGSLRNRNELLLERVTRFDSSLLASAFRGELVPQDPNDEPASVLLEPIRALKPAAGTKRGRGRKAAA